MKKIVSIVVVLSYSIFIFPLRVSRFLWRLIYFRKLIQLFSTHYKYSVSGAFVFTAVMMTAVSAVMLVMIAARVGIVGEITLG